MQKKCDIIIFMFTDEKLRRKKAIFILAIYLLLTHKSSFKSREYNPNVCYNPSFISGTTDCFASYSGGKVFIGYDNLKSEDLSFLDPNDIYICDQRFERFDPNIKVVDSYKITDYEQIYEIIEIINKYEEIYPSKWNRTTRSLKNEWICHNIAYYLSICVERAKDADLNNLHEIIFDSKCLERILKD